MPRPYPKVYKNINLERKDLRLRVAYKRQDEVAKALAAQIERGEEIQFAEVFYSTEWMVSFNLPSAPNLSGKMRARKRQRAGVKKNIIGKYSESVLRRAK